MFREREILMKLKFGVELTQEEENYWFLRMASHLERYEYVKRKKEKQNEITRANSQNR